MAAKKGEVQEYRPTMRYNPSEASLSRAREKRSRPTKLMQFSCDSYDEYKYCSKSRNSMMKHNRSQIFTATTRRNDLLQESIKPVKQLLPNAKKQRKSQIRLDHDTCTTAEAEQERWEEELAVQRGRNRLNHIK